MRLINSSDMKATISGHFKGFSYEFLDKVLIYCFNLSICSNFQVWEETAAAEAIYRK